MPVAVAEVTEADVLKEAIAQIGKPGGFTVDAYFVTSRMHYADSEPGPNVIATCAIGGIEQGIWKLTGKVIDDTARERIARTDPDEVRDRKRGVLALYTAVMKRVNARAKEMYPRDGDGEELHTLESVTFLDEKLAKRRVLRVMRSALKDCS